MWRFKEDPVAALLFGEGPAGRFRSTFVHVLHPGKLLVVRQSFKVSRPLGMGRNGGVEHHVSRCSVDFVPPGVYLSSFPLCFLLQENQLRQRFGLMEENGRQQAPPLPRRTSFERTVTVVRGNRSLGMFPVILVMMVSWCVYVAGMAIISIIAAGDDDCPEEEG